MKPRIGRISRMQAGINPGNALILGAFIWFAVAWLLRLPLEEMILLFAPLVLVRPALDCVGRDGKSDRLLAIAGWLQLPAAIALAASFAFSQGLAAAALALPWLLVTLILAIGGAIRLGRRRWRIDGELAIGAALLLIAVGGGWAAISRSGMRPQNFSHAIVLLTAVHFHYAGFILPLLAGLTVPSWSEGRLPNGLDRALLVLIMAGVPLVGVGISLSPHLEVAAALLLAAGCVLFAVRQVQAALRSRNPARVTWLSLSSLALVSAMIPAAIYACGEFSGANWLDIPTMIRTHGAFNAFGFAACGVMGHSVRPVNR